MFAQILFWVLAAICIISSLVMVGSSNPVRSALALVLTMLSLAVMYITLSAQFIAAVQVVVYAGAVMVLFLFVIMLLNLGAPALPEQPRSMQTVLAIALAGVFLVGLVAAGVFQNLPAAPISAKHLHGLGTVQQIGYSLYSPHQPWLFPFEATSILLLIAVVGAIVLARKQPAETEGS